MNIDGINLNDGGLFGEWRLDSSGLPQFFYRPKCSTKTADKAGNDSVYPEDPYVMLGNDRINIFAHVSGAWQWLHGDGGWCRLNAGFKPNCGNCFSRLNGMDLFANRDGSQHAEWGVGYIRHNRRINDLLWERFMAVPPSNVSGFYTRVRITNEGASPQEFNFEDGIGVCYLLLRDQRTPSAQRKSRYLVRGRKSKNSVVALIRQEANCCDLDLGGEGLISPLDTKPPSVFLHTDDAQFLFVEKISNEVLLMGLRAKIQLLPGQTFEFQWTTGTGHPFSLQSNDELPFRPEWRKRIPDFAEEPDPSLRRELQWHVASLEAMTVHSSVYDECFIPQGCSYGYDIGITASARDIFQHGLATLTYRPSLARSILRLGMKIMNSQGEIRLILEGGSSTTSWFFQTSDQQLYYFWLMADYLKTTSDAGILHDWVETYPPDNGIKRSGLQSLEQVFLYLRHHVNTGQKGLLHLLCSDWNDCIYFFLKHLSYPDLFMGAESTLNAAMAIFVCRRLSEQLNRLAPVESQRLCEGLQQVANEQESALEQIWQGRSFLPRAFVAGVAWGEEDMFLEPQVFALMNLGWSEARKQSLWREVQSRLMVEEKLGPRQRENPPDTERFPAGNRENGGIWYALNGPLCVALADFDRPAAKDILHRMTLAHHARMYPNQWTGIWSGCDNYESSLRATEGMPDPQSIWSDMPIYCAHAHAWPLVAWHSLTPT
jgi:cellobiose phosphorylase